MEWKTILDDTYGEVDELDFSTATLRKDLSAGAQDDFRAVIRSQWVSLAVNTFLLALYGGLYLVLGRSDLLIPLLIIVVAYLPLVWISVRFLGYSARLDRSAPTATVVADLLGLLDQLDHSARRLLPFTATLGFAGGLLGGLLIQGRTLSETVAHPILPYLLVILTIGFAFLIRRYASSLSRRFCLVSHQSRKRRLREVLAELERYSDGEPGR